MFQFNTSLLISITYMITTTQSDGPQCNRATTPFANEQVVLEFVTHILTDCGYNYWKAGATNSYAGVSGFVQMFGEEGHIWNESSIFVTDNQVQEGYDIFRQNSIVSQNLIVFHNKPTDIKVLYWSEFSMFYSWTMSVGLSFVSSEGTEDPQTVRLFSYRTYFSDESQIVQRDWSNSTESLFAGVIQKLFESTRAISDAMGYLDDTEGAKEKKVFGTFNPIQFIFICVVCGAALIVVIAVCVFVKCATRKTRTMQQKTEQTASEKEYDLVPYSENEGIVIKTMPLPKLWIVPHLRLLIYVIYSYFI